MVESKKPRKCLLGRYVNRPPIRSGNRFIQGAVSFDQPRRPIIVKRCKSPACECARCPRVSWSQSVRKAGSMSSRLAAASIAGAVGRARASSTGLLGAIPSGKGKVAKVVVWV
jgi:hypothetical protein